MNFIQLLILSVGTFGIALSTFAGFDTGVYTICGAFVGLILAYLAEKE